MVQNCNSFKGFKKKNDECTVYNDVVTVKPLSLKKKRLHLKTAISSL